jgi:alpha-1,3/alpha-1,6-mannosyltransferase
MSSGLPALACNSGEPTESIINIDEPTTARTGWLRAPKAPDWAVVLDEIAGLAVSERFALEYFGMEWRSGYRGHS